MEFSEFAGRLHAIIGAGSSTAAFTKSIIETILSMKAIEHGVVIATKGFENQGTTYKVNLSARPRPTSARAFVKILSGFGGSNAGIAYRKGGNA